MLPRQHERTLWEIGETHFNAHDRSSLPACTWERFSMRVPVSQQWVCTLHAVHNGELLLEHQLELPFTLALNPARGIIKESIVSSSPGIIYRLIVSPLLKWLDYMHSLSNYQQHFSDCGFQRQWELLLMLITRGKTCRSNLWKSLQILLLMEWNFYTKNMAATRNNFIDGSSNCLGASSLF